MKKRILLLSLAVLTFSMNLEAAPSITSVTYSSPSVTRGMFITITGSGFGTKSPALPIIWADFETSTSPVANLSQNSDWSATLQSLTRITTGTAYGDSSAMLSGVITTNNPSLAMQINLSVWTTAYLSVDVMHDYSKIENEKVVARLWAPGFGLPDYVMSTSQGGIALNEIDTNYPNRFCGGGSCGLTFTANVWDHYKWTWTHGTNVSNTPPGDIGDGTSALWQNGIQHVNQTDIPNGANTATIMILGNFCSSNLDCPSPFGQIFYDNVYLDSVYSRVEISTTSTYSLSTNLKPLPCSSWSSSSLSCWFHADDISYSSTFYVYATDAQNNTNVNGVLLATTITTAPSYYPIRR